MERGNGCSISSTSASAGQPPLQPGKPLCLEQLSNIADHTIAGINRFQLQRLSSTEKNESDKSASQPLLRVGINIWLSNNKTLPDCHRASDESSDAGEIARIIRITFRRMALQHQPFRSGDWRGIDRLAGDLAPDHADHRNGGVDQSGRLGPQLGWPPDGQGHH